ncbi:Fe(3+) ABC transporter substrate-binding protein [Aliikangiella marina]|uniref:Fe(3+) ABC transporter substrate-binding protein n=1 Tax=Aliikangiella marina TaxID=1712262 RepID=A0A545TDC1_9GAMM|nr:Fe(3+) ABC transporter substrate-binding protein [Aliikangiella marina]TQV75218.1 Fe(3+) ABC transporter substrate-binding protein [Aliikangiella marina]
MKKLVLLFAALSSFSVAAQQSVNIYSYRQAFLVDPVVEQFTKDTGIKVNVLFAKQGLAERLEREGEHTKADVVMTTDISRLMEITNRGLTQSVENKTIFENIPAHLRDPKNQWFALTTRVRNIYASKDRVGKIDISYEDLASEKFKGKICTRSGKHPYSVALVSSMISHHGEAETKKWLQGVKANLARKPQGNDRAQVKAIKEGLCDISIGNGYYFGKMLADKNQKAWADSVHILFPNQKDRGAHVNVSGMALTKHAPNKEAAIRLMEYLSSANAQKIYAEANMEYPVKPGVAYSPLVASWGEYKADNLEMAKIAANREKAMKLIDEVKFDL